jgi:hypothetical protein
MRATTAEATDVVTMITAKIQWSNAAFSDHVFYRERFVNNS